MCSLRTIRVTEEFFYTNTFFSLLDAQTDGPCDQSDKNVFLIESCMYTVDYFWRGKIDLVPFLLQRTRVYWYNLNHRHPEYGLGSVF